MTGVGRVRASAFALSVAAVFLAACSGTQQFPARVHQDSTQQIRLKRVHSIASLPRRAAVSGCYIAASSSGDAAGGYANSSGYTLYVFAPIGQTGLFIYNFAFSNGASLSTSAYSYGSGYEEFDFTSSVDPCTTGMFISNVTYSASTGAFASSGGWSFVPPTPAPALWALGKDCTAGSGGCSIYESQNGGATYATVNGRATDIAADPSGSVWIANASGSIYKYDAATAGWDSVPGSASDVALGGGQVWALSSTCNPDCAVFRYNAASNSWQSMSGSGVDIAVDGTGNAWLVNSIGNIYKYNASTGGWNGMPGTASDIAIGNNQVWALSKSCSPDCSVFRFTSSSNSWQTMPGSGVDVSVDEAGNAWIVNSAGNIYKYDAASASGWDQIPGQASDLAAGGQ